MVRPVAAFRQEDQGRRPNPMPMPDQPRNVPRQERKQFFALASALWSTYRRIAHGGSIPGRAARGSALRKATCGPPDRVFVFVPRSRLPTRAPHLMPPGTNNRQDPGVNRGPFCPPSRVSVRHVLSGAARLSLTSAMDYLCLDLDPKESNREAPDRP